MKKNKLSLDKIKVAKLSSADIKRIFGGTELTCHVTCDVTEGAEPECQDPLGTFNKNC